MEAFTEEVGNDPPWEEKTDSRLLWVSRLRFPFECRLNLSQRGSTTGILFADGLAWSEYILHRFSS